MHIKDRIKELRRVKASDLEAHPRNWRTHPKDQRDYMTAILKEVGYADALLAYEHEGKLRLIDGHLRQEITPDQEVPVLVVDVSEEEAEKILITHDPVAFFASADKEKLEKAIRSVHVGEEELQELIARIAVDNNIVPPEEFKLFGWNGDEKKELEEDELPDVEDVEPRGKVGETWQLGMHTLLIGDVFERLKDLPDESIQCVMTSPPYWGLRQYLFDNAVQLRHDIPQEKREQIIQELERHGIKAKIVGLMGRALNDRRCTLSKAVYERDGYRCVRCDSSHTSKISLHAHHIKPWAENPNSRFELKNIVTVCKPCHVWIHSRKNTESEFLRS